MMKISQFLPKGVGVLFPEKPYLKRNNHPLPVKKRNPGVLEKLRDIEEQMIWEYLIREDRVKGFSI